MKRNVNSFGLIRSMLSGAWLIEKSYLISSAPLITKILNGTTDDELIEESVTRCKVYLGQTGKIKTYFDDDDDVDIDMIETFSDVEEPGSVAIIPMIGAIVKYDSWCELGTKTRAEQLRSAKDNPNIIGAILVMDTPGGEALANELMEDAINDFKLSGKPISTFVDGMMCSAGVWIGCSTDEVILSGKSSMVGSIGTMWSFIDIRGWEQYKGVKWHEVYATKSTDKNKDFREAMDNDNYAPMITGTLDVLNEQFLSTVKKHRPDVQETALTGKVYFGQDAIDQGLADGFGTLNTIINNMQMKSKLNSLNQYAGKTELTAEEKTAVQNILKEAGINFSAEPPEISAALFQQMEGDDIYVYSEDNENPTGKRCVYADSDGNPTETNVADGQHELADNRVMTTSTNEEDGFSYVESISGTSDENADDPGTQPDSVTKIVTAVVKNMTQYVDKKFEALRGELVPGSKVKHPKAVNGTGGGAPVEQPSAFKTRKQQILENYKNRRK